MTVDNFPFPTGVVGPCGRRRKPGESLVRAVIGEEINVYRVLYPVPKRVNTASYYHQAHSFLIVEVSCSLHAFFPFFLLYTLCFSVVRMCDHDYYFLIHLDLKKKRYFSSVQQPYLPRSCLTRSSKISFVFLRADSVRAVRREQMRRMHHGLCSRKIQHQETRAQRIEAFA